MQTHCLVFSGYDFCLSITEYYVSARNMIKAVIYLYCRFFKPAFSMFSVSSLRLPVFNITSLSIIYLLLCVHQLIKQHRSKKISCTNQLLVGYSLIKVCNLRFFDGKWWFTKKRQYRRYLIVLTVNCLLNTRKNLCLRFPQKCARTRAGFPRGS